ncbi:MAG: exodeoxyribonuclease VII small subunit [Liquorilactobacillus nagelii]|jgi:exodeoxyribonuclease VII small subunit|uniref:Exodeoxyribonuclease 7 small subunit n=1 Tax=Liquorilactobacillus nagelii TaxID=82688 RepID=A0A3Q8CP66_9LACO|nr:exodeoxyribonuclease VII small subunit [Liquorilactobacillus nagelii]AUJ32274.1 exodeoxyribonuclease VII small subunit [Liquorilactobacillus nagelii]MCI1632402.1 exodeoxyribonuclease VII small subunit [Liquorilactobacillus nagelii]MCI1699503.1 exodeoxyribonuclease VII small subunit [Liquorilactobacillus nagelii]MCI1920517.1 exodeoxyribonuclease VII small subunit [Liquorilactobacillus nagelii]MCI1976160.1 exodeoxyribonuclease VII small subunit [Liquorilactobacillus nagelii]
MTEKPTFETRLADLEKIVQQLEKGDTPLETALDQFQNGIKLSRELQQQLEKAEKTLTQVVDENGKVTDFERDVQDE